MWYDDDEQELDVLVGQTIKSIDGCREGNDEIFIELTDGRRFKFYHSQDCCESVNINEVIGDPEWLVGSPILQARVDTNSEEPKPSGWVDSFTWTFYTLATIKGYVTIRWLGESNGYYSESVSFVALSK